MKSDSLDEHLRAHYRAEQPSEGLLDRMRSIAELEDAAASPRRRGLFLSAVLAATLAFVLWSLPWISQAPGIPQESMLRAVAEEIALNHEGHYEPDVPSAEFSLIVAALDRLDFQPVLPERAADLELVGARYCSLQGNIAAQLQLRDDAGKRFTLYQARHGEQIGKLLPAELDVGTTHVEVWTHRGLVFGLASTLAPKP
ncbi:MAG: hypothetical protein JRH01_09710 [Deltaproteobacteria bacterium]|nr:hypothetical protein [Deltaproteobacteria bacterium]MBW2397485.1 hypothetical protein [Deltaproteobacteria bacterium]